MGKRGRKCRQRRQNKVRGGKRGGKRKTRGGKTWRTGQGRWSKNGKKPGGGKRSGRDVVWDPEPNKIWVECNAPEDTLLQRVPQCYRYMKCTHISNNQSNCGKHYKERESPPTFEECCFECEYNDQFRVSHLCRRRNETLPSTGTSPGFELYRKTVHDAFIKLASAVKGYITNFADEFLFGRKSPL